MRLSVLLGLAMLALAGCGGTSSSLDDAPEATSAETSRFELDYRVTGGPAATDYTMQAAGAFDFPNERAAMTLSGAVPFFADEDISWKEFRVIGKTSYMRWTVKGKTYWVKDDLEGGGSPTDLLVPLPGTPTKPTDVLTRVLLASEENQELGEEEIRGTDTTHYRARVDLQKLAKQLPPKERPEGDASDLWGTRFVPVELWIDDESRLRRITFVERNDEGPEAMTMTAELYDYGVEVDVEPPADDVISQAEFDRLTSHAEGWTSSGDGGETSLKELCESLRKQLPKKDAEQACLEMKEQQ
jgi:hypothetical protein